ncbi:MAG: hypothetical protein EXR64_01935 [Dehalococcoidia bacterium]|nr:hypothetical protein [Dehalococcoidia bacterium]
MTTARPAREAPTKLVMMIVSDTDDEALMYALVQSGYSATKVGSTGGFLRRGSVTIYCGVAAAEVDAVVAMVREICRARREFVPIPAALAEEGGFTAEPIEVRTGGAIVFVLDIDRFERL